MDADKSQLLSPPRGEITASTHGLRSLRTVSTESFRERGDLLRLPLVLEFAGVVEGFVGGGDGDLVGEDEDADVAEDGAQGDEAAQAAEGAG